MVMSMTAFAREEMQNEWGHITWEIKSVNHRYLDLNFKIPDLFREYELDWRNWVSQKIKRGKVEFLLSFVPSQKTAPSLRINKNLVDKLISNCQAIMQYPGVSTHVEAIEILRWPDVLITECPDFGELKTHLLNLLKTTVETLIQTRLREGKQLQSFIKEKAALLLDEVMKVKSRAPQCMMQLKQRMVQRIQDLQIAVDAQRLEQELVFYAQRTDVLEEIERLQAHVEEVHRVLDKEQAAGRRLDFLMQEMGREANTLAAKVQEKEMSQAAIEMKVLIEQMREQIQNVE